MLNQLTSSQLSEWEAYNSIDPVGEWRRDYMIASMMALIANINRDTKKKPEAYTHLDFMPEWSKPKIEEKPQTVVDQKRILFELFGLNKKK